MRPVLLYWQFVQLFAMSLPAFYESLTQPERYVHFLITAVTSMLTLQAFNGYGRRQPNVLVNSAAILCAVAVLSLVLVECLAVASKSIVPLWSQRLWLFAFCAAISVFLSHVDCVLSARRISRNFLSPTSARIASAVRTTRTIGS